MRDLRKTQPSYRCRRRPGPHPGPGNDPPSALPSIPDTAALGSGVAYSARTESLEVTDPQLEGPLSLLLGVGPIPGDLKESGCEELEDPLIPSLRQEADVPRCPVCRSARILVILDARPRARCFECEATWAQRGSEQRDIRRPAFSLQLVRTLAR